MGTTNITYRLIAAVCISVITCTTVLAEGKGRYALLFQGEWRRRWIAHIPDQDAPWCGTRKESPIA